MATSLTDSYTNLMSTNRHPPVIIYTRMYGHRTATARTPPLVTVFGPTGFPSTRLIIAYIIVTLLVPIRDASMIKDVNLQRSAELKVGI